MLRPVPIVLAVSLLALGGLAAAADPAPTAEQVYLAGPASQCIPDAPIAVGVVCFDVPRDATHLRLELADRSGLPVGGSWAFWVSWGSGSMFGFPRDMCGAIDTDVQWSESSRDLEVYVWLGGTPGCAEPSLGTARVFAS